MKKFLLSAIALVLMFVGPAYAADKQQPSTGKVIKVLAIGNSFSEDSIEQNLWQIAQAQGVDMVIGNMYIGGCSVDRHYKNITEDIPDYRYCKITADGNRQWSKSSHLKDVIKDEAWDFVSIQQVSQDAGMPGTYAHLQEVVDWIRANAPQAEVVFHQTWAYGPDSSHGGFLKYDRDQLKMYQAVVGVTKEQAEKVGITTIIPTGTALQDARTTRLGADLTRDGFHMSKGFGRYLAACTWFETLTGHDVSHNTYVPDGSQSGTEPLSSEDAAIARRAAHQAVAVPFEIVPIYDFQSLDGAWSLSFWRQPEEPVTSPEGLAAVADVQTIPAVVPGNVDIDLCAAGLEEDPRIGNNNYLTRKWEAYQWCYSRTFNFQSKEEGKHYQLFFGGIDTIADIWLNGENIGHTENMLVEHTFDVTKFLKEGENELKVFIQSSTIYGRKPFFGSVCFGHSASPESVNIRKAPHMFGWDILPRVVSAGLWRSVELRSIDRVHLRDCNWQTATIDKAAGTAELTADVQFDMPVDMFDKTTAVFTLSRNGKQVYKGSMPCVYHALRHKIHLEDVEYWWPRGYGEPALYDAKCELVAPDGTVLACDVRKFGIRTVKLDFNEINLLEAPGRFCFVINGEPIFIHGTNWVPVDALHSRDYLWLDETVAMAADMNCNMIRCWGGNVYEDHRFYELCDKYGIMVWQDFTFACNAYPQTEDFSRRIYDEVRSEVIKVRRHPSIVLWSGNNEVDQSLRRSNGCYDPDPNRDIISREVIARVLWEFDPSRPYIPSSPYYTSEVWKRGFIDYEHVPENHLWGPRGYYKTPFYTEAGCVFVSEIGYHGAPSVSSLERMMTPDCVYPWDKKSEMKEGEPLNPMGEDMNWNEQWLTKSVRRFPELGKDYPRNNLMINQQNLLFGSCPRKLEDFVLGSQVVQAEAMKYFVELWRGQKFDPKTGIIWWNIKDGWPNISDAVVDYYFNKKLAYYFIKNVQQNVCCMVLDAKKGKFPVIAVNDTPEEVKGTVTVSDVASGRKVFEGDFSIAPNSKTEVGGIKEKEGAQGVYLIEYTVGGKVSRNHYLYGKAPFNFADYKEWMSKTGIYEYSWD